MRKTPESTEKARGKLREEYSKFLSINGVGKILAFTVMLETGTLKRFPKSGNYALYCRKVPSHWTSNGKKKGKGNDKKGNTHLAWGFSEVAEIPRRFDEHARRFFNKKAAKTNRMVAHPTFIQSALILMGDWCRELLTQCQRNNGCKKEVEIADKRKDRNVNSYKEKV